MAEELTARPELATETGRAGPNQFALGSGHVYGLWDVDPCDIDLATLDRMRRDPVVNMCLKLKTMLVTTHLGEYKPPEGPRTDELEAFVKRAWKQMRGTVRQVVSEQLYTSLWSGFAVGERVWGSIPIGEFKGKWFYEKIKTLDPRTIYPNGIVCDVYGNVQDIKQFRGQHNETSIPPARRTLWAYQREHENPYGTKALSYVYRSWYSGDAIAYDFLPKYLERFGSPPLRARIPEDKAGTKLKLPGTGQEVEITEYFNVVLQEMANRACWVYYEPRGLQEPMVDVVEPPRGGASGFIESWKQYDTHTVLGLLAPPLGILEGEHMSRAAAGEHKDVGLMDPENILSGLSEELMIEQLIRPLITTNYGPQEDYGSWVPEPLTEDDKQALASVVATLVGAGVIDPHVEECREWIAQLVGMPVEAVQAVEEGLFMQGRVRSSAPPEMPREGGGETSSAEAVADE
ncbi:MAG: hypothetical protein GF320_11350 [Armatimonadia bacterium]|nr:hypothetical protein [Armatimonadia bacterium]